MAGSYSGCRLATDVEEDSEQGCSVMSTIASPRQSDPFNRDQYFQKSLSGQIVTCDSGSGMEFDNSLCSFSKESSVTHSIDGQLCSGIDGMSLSGKSLAESKDRVDSGFVSGDVLDFGYERLSYDVDKVSSENLIVESNHGLSEEQRRLYTQDEDGDTELHLSIIQLVPSNTKLIIDRAPSQQSLNLMNRLRQTPLHLAVIVDQPVVVLCLLKAGALLELTDMRGNTPLHIACKEGHVKCAEALTNPAYYSNYPIVNQRIPQNLEAVNYEGKTCLHLASEGFLQTKPNEDYRRIVFQLLKAGANVNAQDGKSGRTILHYCAEYGNMEFLKILLNHGCVNVNTTTYAGKTPAMLAMGRNCHAIVTELVKNGAFPPPENKDDTDSSDMSDEDMMMEYNDFSVNGYPLHHAT